MEEEEEEEGGEKEVCANALTSDEGEGDDIASSTAYTSVTCSLLCMEDVFDNSEYQSAQFESRVVGGVWRFLFFPEFSPENRDNCPAYREFAECVRGCLVRVDPERANFTSNECRNECKGECDDEYQMDSQYNLYCSINCDKGDCRQGCENYGKIKRSSSVPGSPASPVSAPLLVSADASGEAVLLSVNLSHSAPPTNDQEPSLPPVGVVYRVQDKDTHITRYLAQVDLEEPLRLDEFACRNISLSFVVVNKFGVSHESTPLSLRVPGGPLTISKATHVAGSAKVDKRPGFFGHAELTITWQHPPDYVPGLYQYIVKVIRYNTKDSYSSTLLNTTTLTVHSERESDTVFNLGNRLDIQVCTVVGEEEECEVKLYDIPAFESLVRNSVEITACVAQWNGSLFNYTLHWRVPEFIAFGNDIFTVFVVAANEKHSGKPLSFWGSFTIHKQPNQTSYSFTWTNLKPLHSQYYYEFGVTIQWAKSDVYQKPSVQEDSCDRQAIPPPPSPVLNVTLSGFKFLDGNIRFSLRWEPPVTTNGRLTHYLACLGGRQLRQYEDYDPVSTAPTDENDTNCITIGKVATTYIWEHRTPRPDCLYFQMRAHSEYGGGEWSKVMAISHGTLDSKGKCNDVLPRDNSTIVIDDVLPRDNSTIVTDETSTLVPVMVAVGTTLAIIVVATLSILVVVCGKIHRRKRKLQRFLKRQRSDEADLMFTGGTKKAFTPQTDMLITTDDWELPPNQVIVEDNIGEGAFGEVLKGTVKGPLSNPKVPAALKSAICIPVAIKMLKSSAKGSERRDFLQEIEIMKKVSEGQNPHVVSMVGCVTVQEPLSLITEFIPFGNLLQYLRTNRKMYTEAGEAVEDNPYVGLGNVSSLDLISFAYQIASGMEYLSSLGIVHRDLASRNILVGEGKVLKITDLGMSRETDEVYVQKTKGRVPLKWMAVESIITREFTSASDVWAYGVVLWEIGTLGGFPYPSIQNEDLLPLLKQGYRMEKPDNCSSEVYAIMLECWQEEPGKRPTFSKLRTSFDNMLMAEKKDPYIDLQVDASKPYYNPDLAEADPEQNDGLLHVGKTSKSSSKVSVTSPFHAKGVLPSHSDSSDTPVIFRGQRSPRSLSPVPAAEKLPRPTSLQLLTERKNTNHYVDDPSTRRSIHISPPEWSLIGYQGGASDGSVPVQMSISGRGRSHRDEAERDGSAVPDIFISFS